MNSQEERYYFLLQRDGKEKAKLFLLENVIRAYRKAVLDKTKYTMYRRQLITGYVQAKKLYGSL